jgi:ribonuclease HII
LFDYNRLSIEAEQLLSALTDSKRLSALTREQLAPVIREHATATAVVARSSVIIDMFGIQPANMDVLAVALRKVRRRGSINLVDGFALRNVRFAHTKLIGGDRTSAAVAAASILAKTTRDQMMRAAAVRWPQYGFDRHAGYGTVAHRAAIAEHGLSPLHRRSFSMGLPVLSRQHEPESVAA